MSKNKITKKWTIAKIVEKYPQSADILVVYGFHCIGCAMAAYETLEQGADVHGLEEDDLVELVKKLNKLIDKE